MLIAKFPFAVANSYLKQFAIKPELFKELLYFLNTIESTGKLNEETVDVLLEFMRDYSDAYKIFVLRPEVIIAAFKHELISTLFARLLRISNSRHPELSSELICFLAEKNFINQHTWEEITDLISRGHQQFLNLKNEEHKNNFVKLVEFTFQNKQVNIMQYFFYSAIKNPDKINAILVSIEILSDSNLIHNEENINEWCRYLSKCPWDIDKLTDVLRILSDHNWLNNQLYSSLLKEKNRSLLLEIKPLIDYLERFGLINQQVLIRILSNTDNINALTALFTRLEQHRLLNAENFKKILRYPGFWQSFNSILNSLPMFDIKTIFPLLLEYQVELKYLQKIIKLISDKKYATMEFIQPILVDIQYAKELYQVLELLNKQNLLTEKHTLLLVQNIKYSKALAAYLVDMPDSFNVPRLLELIEKYPQHISEITNIVKFLNEQQLPNTDEWFEKIYAIFHQEGELSQDDKRFWLSNIDILEDFDHSIAHFIIGCFYANELDFAEEVSENIILTNADEPDEELETLMEKFTETTLEHYDTKQAMCHLKKVPLDCPYSMRAKEYLFHCQNAHYSEDMTDDRVKKLVKTAYFLRKSGNQTGNAFFNTGGQTADRDDIQNALLQIQKEEQQQEKPSSAFSN